MSVVVMEVCIDAVCMLGYLPDEAVGNMELVDWVD